MPTDLSSSTPDWAAANVVRAVLLRSELIPPSQTDGLIEAIVEALKEAQLLASPPNPARFNSDAHLDMLDRFRGRK